MSALRQGLSDAPDAGGSATDPAPVEGRAPPGDPAAGDRTAAAGRAIAADRAVPGNGAAAAPSRPAVASAPPPAAVAGATRWRPLREPLRTGPNGETWLKVVLAVAGVAAYIVAFIPPFLPEHAIVTQLAAIPIVVFAWLFGFWGGTITALVIIPFNALVFSVVTDASFSRVLTSQDDLLPAVLLLVLGAVLGGLRDIRLQMRGELETRHRVEEARRESEERYRFVAESASDGILTIDQDRRILFANRGAERIFSMNSRDMVGLPFRALIPDRLRDDHDAALREHLDAVVTGRAEQALQIAGSGRGHREITLEISFGEYMKHGRHIFTGVVRDVTERKQLEQMLKRAKADAEQANRAKSDFLSRMSHELRTPLNAILGFAQLLEMDATDPDEAESVEQILKAGRHLLSLVDEVLDIARIEAGRMALSPEPLSVRQMTEEAWDLVRHRADQAGVTFREPPAGQCDAWVTADRQRLKQVLLNLLSNAVKYNRQNGTVAVSCGRGMTGANRIRVSVSDTGRGIPEDLVDRLFRPFERLGAEQTSIEGTGIGLAVSRGLIEAMDGEIGVESAEGEGSTFWFELPLDFTRAAPPPTGATPRRPADGPADPVREISVLYIEDNPSNFRLVERILAHRPGTELVTAMTGGRGLELARLRRPDVILLDLHLPDMHGAEIMQEIRDDPGLSRTPIVIISADVTSDRAQELMRDGARAYLAKPLDVREFLRVLDQVVES